MCDGSHCDQELNFQLVLIVYELSPWAQVRVPSGGGGWAWPGDAELLRPPSEPPSGPRNHQRGPALPSALR